MKRPDVVVVGGGIIGLMTAWHLAERGLRIRVLDRGPLGREASLTAAGMLLPQAETDPVAPDTPEMEFFRLLLRARDGYPETMSRIQGETGGTVFWDRQGAVAVAVDESSAKRLEGRVDWQRGLGLPVETLSPSGLRSMAPGVEATAAAFFPGESRVDTRDLLDALIALLRKKDVTLDPDHPVDMLLHDDNRVTGVRTGNETVEAGAVLLAAGSWCSRLLPPGEAAMDIRPSLGVLVRAQPDTGLALPILAAEGFYSIPLPDGDFLLGSTVEDVGFDRRVRKESMERVLSGVAEFLPVSRSWPVAGTRSGFRPRSADDLPVLGPGRRSGLWLATGHFRNGILLAPLTAGWMAEGIASGTMPPEAAPFAPARFS